MPSEKDAFQFMNEGLAKCLISGIRLDNPLIVQELIKMKGLALLQQKYGGKSLMHTISYANDNKTAITANFIYTLFYKFANVFKGLELYHDNCFVHLDIRPHNLVCDDTCYIIDFGLSVPLKTYKPGNPRFESESPFFIKKHFEFYPFDSNYIKRWHKLFDESGKMQLNKDEIINHWHMLKKIQHLPQQFYAGQFFDDTFIQFSHLLEFIEIYRDIFDNLLQLNEGDTKRLKPTLRNYLMKQVDVYSLGLTLCQLTYYLTKKILDINGNIQIVKGKEHIPAVPNEIVKSLYMLGMKMMHVHPFKRLSISSAYTEYKQILKEMPIVKTAATEKIFDLIESSPHGLDPYLLTSILSV